MVRRELHSVRRPFFDCTSYRRPAAAVTTPANSALHLHAEMTRSLPQSSPRYSDVKVALRLSV